ncbi:type III-B CRISPR module RAMP protein Cmr6 [Azospirillum lipoferum]|uniref:CRISPR type III-associated protein domain-containing protein n=1 Tax=Azospirillum lipoferum (strain 4B) TaxID=862719 RepID=G7ZE28_AZOL4|nr:type III-B CRISPR module RAMP protein Cmr6 [Azospirillum lipoferum]CBS89283.1 exported protein of unknown function [Azospirillum lipoferum 4B]
MSRLFALAPGGPAGWKAVADQVEAPTANAALVWDRYFPIWTGEPRSPRRWTPIQVRRGDKPEPSPLALFVAAREGAKAQQVAWLSERTARMERTLRTLAAATGQEFLPVEAHTVWRFVMGLGAAHPTGNGFVFDPTTGLPVIPGSAVKGLCRQAAAESGIAPEKIAKWFGPERDRTDNAAAMGCVRFFDAFPSEWPRFTVDIVNGHHGDWYERQARALAGDRTAQREIASGPAETEDPVPAQFLVLGDGVTFRFPLLTPPDIVADVRAVLKDGLDWLGLGAKTAIGYGAFRTGPVPVLPPAKGPGGGSGQQPPPLALKYYYEGDEVRILERWKGGLVLVAYVDDDGDRFEVAERHLTVR